jgi:glycosyltransferase involved in cell wall biosynthesis
MMRVPLSVIARNEERSIGPCLEALLVAKGRAGAELGIGVALEVVLDECTDGTESVVRALGVACWACSGGKVEAQRGAVERNRSAPFHIFCDADVLVAEDAISALCSTMLGDSSVDIAFPPKMPLPAHRRTPLAWALHVYNSRHGFSSQRSWFSGKLFAIRRWEMPSPAEMARRASALPRSRFYGYGKPLRVDDIYLSRRAGSAAVRETRSQPLLYRAPETWRGMYRYYRRMRRELERTDALFPELRDAAAVRRADLLGTASAAERAAWLVFQSALLACRAVYRLDRLLSERDIGAPSDPWPPISETKELSCASVRRT